MVVPGVCVGDISIVQLFPAKLIDHILDGCSVESSEHSVRMDRTGFGWRGGDGSRRGLSTGLGFAFGVLLGVGIQGWSGDGGKGRDGGQGGSSSEDGSLEVKRSHGWSRGKKGGMRKVISNDNRHLGCMFL